MIEVELPVAVYYEYGDYSKLTARFCCEEDAAEFIEKCVSPECRECFHIVK